ncbi:sugar phosphate isomerase/epimerase family protein [Brachybacterium hainanense]|uniref:Sugar phosphate isomerase/epimerase family protein n=1 Tax=Brachybacterium hainanense TaxID=1541174 RepID=A0ABV6R8F1_9MICO
MIRPGLCSVTFRELAAAEVVRRAAAAGLACIEWGGDVHVPAGDIDAARRVRALTESAGLEVASYGSYLRFVGPEVEVAAQARDVLLSAEALGAPRIRVWAGEAGSASTSPEERAEIVHRIRKVADAAAARGIDLGLEFHGGTLTDEISSTLALLAEIGHEAVWTYWQPHQSQPTEEALATLRAALAQVSTVHVFSWWPGGERLALAEREDLWTEAFGILAAEGKDHDALLEFVPGDDPELLDREAMTLRSWLGLEG